MQKAHRKKPLRFIIHMTFAVVSSFPICKCVGLEEYIKIEMDFTLSFCRFLEL